MIQADLEEDLKDPEFAEEFYREMWRTSRDLRRVKGRYGRFCRFLWSFTRR